MKKLPFLLALAIILFAGCSQSDPAVKTADAAVDIGDIFGEVAIAGGPAASSTPSPGWDEVIIEKNPGPGPYVGKARGHGAWGLTVTIEVAGGKLISVEADGPDETAGMGTRALVMIPEAMLKANSIKVDAVSGSTETSEAVLLAAARALGQAGLTDDDLKR